MAKISALRRRSTELLDQAKSLEDRLDAHSELGDELDWDYDSDGVRNTRLIMDNSEIDV